jgi:hypothetical protein
VTTSPSGVSSYAEQVGKQLRGLPSEQRREVADDVRQRLADMGIATWDDAVAQLGPPADYAEELREAAGWPRPGVPRWPFVVAIAVVLAVVGGMLVQRATAVPTDYPLRFGSSMVAPPASMAGSVVVMPERTGEPAVVGFELTNDGDRTVRLDEVQRFPGASMQDGSLVYGGDGVPPLWEPEARVFRMTDPTRVTFTDFDDPSGADLAGFAIEPGETVVLQLRGPVRYCIDAPDGSAVGDRVRLNTTIDGERRVITGTELTFPLDNCS